MKSGETVVPDVEYFIMAHGTDLWEHGDGQYSYMRAPVLLRQGKLGTALRKHDPIAFNVGFDEWRP